MLDQFASDCGLLAAFDLKPLTEGVDGDGRVAITVVAIGAIIAIVAILASLFDKVHRRAAETALKRDMSERGMTIDEIERVLEMKSGRK